MRERDLKVGMEIIREGSHIIGEALSRFRMEAGMEALRELAAQFKAGHRLVERGLEIIDPPIEGRSGDTSSLKGKKREPLSGLTPLEKHVLGVLFENLRSGIDIASINQAKLAARLDIDQGTISRGIRRFIARGYVARIDRQTFKITDKGKSLFDFSRDSRSEAT